MRNPTIILIILVALVASGTAEALTVYTDRPEFTAANPGLVAEGFETNNLGASTSKLCPTPLDSSSDNSCFGPGQLAAGVEYDLQDNPTGTQLALAGPVDTLTSRIGANNVNDLIVARFMNSNTTAVGLELICTLSPRTGTVRFFGLNGLILEQPVNCSATGDFIAIVSEEPIIRIEAEAPGTFEYIDNVLFGSATIFSAFTDRAEFEALFPLLSTEGFEAGDLGGSGAVACPSPLDSSSDNSCFSPGDLIAGVEYRVQDSPLINQLSLSAPRPGRSTSLGPNGFSDFVIVSFSGSRTNAVGLDLYCFVNPGQASIRFYSADGLITEQTFDCSATTAFTGIAVNKHITHIEAEQVGEYEFIDNLSFGRAVKQIIYKNGFE